MKIQQDNHLIEAGKNVMYLAWFESTMRNLLTLAESSDDARERYNQAHPREGRVVYPTEFAYARLEVGELTLGQLTKRCLERFAGHAAWQEESVSATIESLSLLRNAFAHAHFEPHRPFLLYTPDARALRKIKRGALRCWSCRGHVGICVCHPELEHDPPALILRANDHRLINALNDDLERIDLRCFVPTAYELGVVYQGLAWWQEQENACLVVTVETNGHGGVEIVRRIVR